MDSTKLSKTEQFARLLQLGFDVAPHFKFSFKEMDENALTVQLNNRRELSLYEIDGLVIEVNDATTRQRINPSRDTLNPAYAVKFKIADASNIAETEVIRVEWNISKDGYYKPRVQFAPVNLVGVTITNATGFNAKYIQDNVIGPGAIIKITRSGDVIPFILGVVKPAPSADMPKDEDAVWTATGVDLIVKNAQSNDAVKFEQLNDFFNTLNVSYLGEGNLRKLFECGLTTPESILQLTAEDIGGVIGSPVIGKKIFSGCKEALTDIPLYELMGAHPSMGRGVGVRKMKKLWEAFCGDMSLCTSIDRITQVDGFDHKTATKIINGYPAFVVFFDKIKDRVKLTEYIPPKEGRMTGKTVVLTGFRSKEIEQAVVDAGGKIGTSVSSKTTYLVAEDPNSTSTKAQKARDLGITVLGVKDFLKLLQMDNG